MGIGNNYRVERPSTDLEDVGLHILPLTRCIKLQYLFFFLSFNDLFYKMRDWIQYSCMSLLLLIILLLNIPLRNQLPSQRGRSTADAPYSQQSWAAELIYAQGTSCMQPYTPQARELAQEVGVMGRAPTTAFPFSEPSVHRDLSGR